MNRGRAAAAGGRDALPRGACLRLSAPVGAQPAEMLAAAVLKRVGGTSRELGTVILDVGPITEVSAGDCAALLALHYVLATTGTRLRLAGVGTGALRCPSGADLVAALGHGAIHPTLRSAVLATAAEQPGPGLCTGAVRAGLAQPAEPLRL
jgi:hypothetical protein